jgi:phenylacetic acid degradation operon negative regulatory protein
MPEGDPAGPLRPRSLDGAPAARSLLLTILGEYVLDLPEPVWTAALVRGLGPLGVGEKAARQAIARSAAGGWIERDRVGRRVRWRLAAPTRRLLERGRERIYGFTGIKTGWDGRWLVVMVSVPEDRRDDRHRVRTRLAWSGFGSLGQGTWISPHLEREREALEALVDLGPAVRATSFIARHGDIGDERELVVDAWGGLEELERRYQAFIDRHQGCEPAGGEATFVAQTRLVHEWRRFPFADPGLPERFLPAGWKGVAAGGVFRRCHQRWAAAALAWFLAGSREP